MAEQSNPVQVAQSMLQDAQDAAKDPTGHFFRKKLAEMQGFIGGLVTNAQNTVQGNTQGASTTMQFGLEGMNQQNKAIGERSGYDSDEQKVLKQYKNEPMFKKVQEKLSGLDSVCGSAFSSIATINVFEHFGDVMTNPTGAGLNRVLKKCFDDVKEGFGKLLKGDVQGAFQEFGDAFKEGMRLMHDRDGIAIEMYEEKAKNLYEDLKNKQPDGKNFSPRMASLMLDQIREQYAKEAKLPIEKLKPIAELTGETLPPAQNVPAQPAVAKANAVNQAPAAPAPAQSQNPLDLGAMAQNIQNAVGSLFSSITGGGQNNGAVVAEAPDVRPAQSKAQGVS